MLAQTSQPPDGSAPHLTVLLQQQQELLQALQAEVKILKLDIQQLRSDLRQQQSLGFSNGREYIIIERDKTTLWHRFEDDQPVPIKDAVLKGYLTRVAFVDKEYPKLHIYIEGDREYVLVTGFETHFAREILAAIATLRPADLTFPVIIKPDTGSEESEPKSKHRPVFCNVIHQGRLVKPGTFRQMDIQQLFQLAQSKLQGQTQSSDLAEPTATAAAVPPESAATPPAPASIDWEHVCRELNITPADLKQVAQRLKLPMGKLTRSQSEQLHEAVYRQFSQED